MRIDVSQHMKLIEHNQIEEQNEPPLLIKNIFTHLCYSHLILRHLDVNHNSIIGDEGFCHQRSMLQAPPHNLCKSETHYHALKLNKIRHPRVKDHKLCTHSLLNLS
jgi:hypothetical protein